MSFLLGGFRYVIASQSSGGRVQGNPGNEIEASGRDLSRLVARSGGLRLFDNTLASFSIDPASGELGALADTNRIVTGINGVSLMIVGEVR